jgi:hypothetical protein
MDKHPTWVTATLVILTMAALYLIGARLDYMTCMEIGCP